MIEQLKNVLDTKRIWWRRGDGFLFVKSETRAIEVSENDDSLWLEFWASSDEDADDPPVKECDCYSVDAAVRAIDDWLNKDGGGREEGVSDGI